MLPSEKQFMERKENIHSILQFIRVNGPKSRREISNSLHLSWGCVSELVSILISNKILLDDTLSETKSMGRKSLVLRLNPDVYFLGVDINKIGLKACICNLLGDKITEFNGELAQNSKYTFTNSIASFLNPILKEYNNICGIGFAMQGILSRENGLWEFPSDNGIIIDFAKDIESLFNLPVTVRHDPDCILYGCFDDNSGSKMIVRLDSGIGVSVFKNNTFLKNELMEIGYFVINDKGDRLHNIISSFAFKNADDLDAHLSFAGKHLGIVLGNICNFFRFDEVYFCGDLINNYNLLNTDFYEFYNKTVIDKYAAKIIPVSVTDAAYGAAKMAMDVFSINK